MIPTRVQVTGEVAGRVGGTATTTGPPISVYIIESQMFVIKACWIVERELLTYFACEFVRNNTGSRVGNIKPKVWIGPTIVDG